MSRLLARYADALFWMARYVERAENLARILDVQQGEARADEPHAWDGIVRLNSDEDRFFARHPQPTPDAVLQFYVLDTDNPTSILSALRAARDNARALRPLISTEMWTQINVFYNTVRALGPADIGLARLPKLCALVKEGCQSHTGVTEGTMHRDQGRHFYQLGRYLERADQTTRLLDAKWRALAGRRASPLEAGAWGAVLRSAAGYHAFRRIRPSGMVPAEVVGFLLFNDSFPRSVMLCVHEAYTLLAAVRTRSNLRGGARAMEVLDSLRALLETGSAESVANRDLPHYFDLIQRHLGRVGDELGRDFFGNAPAPPRIAASLQTGQA